MWSHNYHIVVIKTYVILDLAVADVIIHIDSSHLLIFMIEFDDSE